VKAFVTATAAGQRQQTTMDHWRSARAMLGGLGDLDRVLYLDNNDREIVVHDETTWGNFLVALAVNGSASRDSRFRFATAPSWLGPPGQRMHIPQGRNIPFNGLPVGSPERRRPTQQGGGGGPSRAHNERTARAVNAETTAFTLVMADRPGQNLQAHDVAPATPFPSVDGARWNRLADELRFTPDPWASDRQRLVLRDLCRLSQWTDPGAWPGLHALRPYSSHVWRVACPGDAEARMVRVTVSPDSSLQDGMVQLITLDSSGRMIDLRRHDLLARSRTVNGMLATQPLDTVIPVGAAAELLIIVASREQPGDYTLGLSRIEDRALLFASPWNAVGLTSFSADPRQRAWTWRSPDLLVSEETWKIRLRLANLGDADAEEVKVRFWRRCISGCARGNPWQEMFFPNRSSTTPPKAEQPATPPAAGQESMSGQDAEIDGNGRLAPFALPSAATCREARTYNYPLLTGNYPENWARPNCQVLPDDEMLTLQAPWPRVDGRPLDPKSHLLMARVTSANNADWRGLTIVTSPGGAWPNPS